MSRDPKIETEPNAPVPRARLLLLATFAAITFATIAGYAVHFSNREVASLVPATASSEVRLANLLQHPHLLFRDATPGPTRGHLAVVSLQDPRGPRAPIPVLAERVYGAAGNTIALVPTSSGVGTYDVVVLDAKFQARTSVRLAGVPDRARVSRNGKLAAATGFVSGDSYDPGGFSTRTSFIDLAAGTYVTDLEDFKLWRDGSVVQESDVNFWGVSFAGEDGRFFASVATRGVPYLIEGNLNAREATVRRGGVECPSLSPDGTRLAFKSRRPGGEDIRWGLHVMDLRSGAEVTVAEARNVDDQAEWLDDSTLLYTVVRPDGPPGTVDVWAARADGTGTPELFVENASSPCVQKP